MHNSLDTTRIQLIGVGGRSSHDRLYFRCIPAKNITDDQALKHRMAWTTPEGETKHILIDGYLATSDDLESFSFTRLKRDRNSGEWVEKDTHPDGLRFLQHKNSQGYGIYFVPNIGGRTDAEISRCSSLFYECDGISKDEQWQRLKGLEAKLGRKASLVNETRKSLHVYLSLDEPIDPTAFRHYQQRLIQHQDSDSSIVEPAQLMRSAGYDHWAWNQEAQKLEPTPVRVAQFTYSRFSLAELDSVLPEWDEARWETQTHPSERVETDPDLDPWDIRNLAQSLEGYNPNGRRGWITAKCPAHNGQSNNSLHIEQSTGAFKCHAGCDPKDVYHAAKDAANAAGYQLPERRERNTSKSRNWLHNVEQQLKQYRKSPWGFKRIPEKTEGQNAQTQAKREAANDATGRNVSYQETERLVYWGTALSEHKFTLDSSAPGTGKSHSAGLLAPEGAGVRQIIYLSDQHRNPEVSTLATWTDLEARHGGLVKEQRPNGETRLRRAKKGEATVISANCGRNGLVSALRAKNVDGSDTAATVCRTCPYLEPCRGGHVYGFLGERAESLQASRLRAHPQSLPSPREYDYENVALVWDEASQILKTTQTIEVTQHDLTQVIAELAVKCPKQFKDLRPLLSELKRLLSGEVSSPKFGWNHNQVVEMLPSFPPFNSVVIDEALAPDLGFLNTTEEYGVDLEDLPPHLRKRFTERDPDLAEQATKEVTKQWLLEFLDILEGRQGYLHIKHGTLTITLRDTRLAEIAASAKGNLFLDATVSPKDLAQALGCDGSMIFQISQATADNENLEIVQVTSMGRLGLGRGADQQRRAEAVMTYLSQQDPDTKFIDFKKFTAEGDGKGKWWTDSRASNDFQNISNLALTGTPCRNLDDLKAEFACLYGRIPAEGSETVRYPIEVNNPLPDDVEPFFEMEDSIDPEFRGFVRRKIKADIDQAIERLRSRRRPEKKLKVYFLADYPLDRPVTLVKASDLTPEAAGKVERVEIAIRRAVADLKAQGLKVTQQAIAEVTGFTQGYISRFRKLLQMLLDPLYSKSNNSGGALPDGGEREQVTANVLTKVSTQPPEVVLECIDEAFNQWLKPEQWPKVWDLLTAEVQIRLMQALVLVLPAWELEQLAKET